jgi:hypothetical protein
MKNIFNKMTLSIVGALVVAVVGFGGCSKNDSSKTNEPEVYTDPELQGAKQWVMMPFVEGFVADIGIAKRNAGNDFSFQRQEAMGDARSNLAQQISVKVNTMFKSYKAATGSGADATFDKSSEAVSKQIASKTLKGTRIKDTWMSRSGTLYVLMIVDTKSVSEMMDQQIKTSFKNDKAMYQKFLASKAQGELDAELSKLNK